MEQSVGGDRQSEDTVVVVPCYNEAERLDVETFKAYAAGAPSVRFLFVNDGSTDRTSEVLAALSEARPEAFEVHELARNAGKAEAVRAGILKALESRPGFVAFWDADLSTPLEELEAFRDVFDRRPEIEMIFGARVNLMGRSVRRKLFRHYIGRVFATIVATATRLPIYDTQCGAKLFRVNDRIGSLFSEPFLSKWIFDVEIIARAILARRGADGPPAAEIICEQPLMSWYDVQGSKIRLRDFVIVATDFVRIYRRYLRRRR